MADHPNVVSCTVVLLLLAFALLTAPATAPAAESSTPTRQQVAMNAEWLSHLAPEDLPPVEQRGIVCLVDSGVDITPDLPADRPEGPIVSRQVSGAITREGDRDDGQGGSSYAAQHGTRMASYAAASHGNDWGTVGLVPWVRIVSVRAMPKTSTSFPSDGYQAAIRTCQRLKDRWTAMAVVNLSFGCGCSLSASEQALLDDAWQSADLAGLAVVAAAGNRSVNVIDSPASTDGVLPVMASEPQGQLCPFSNSGDGALPAPGCGLDAQDGSGVPVSQAAGGTSAASVMTSSIVASLRSLSPSLTSSGVVEALKQTRVGGRLDVAAGARLLGLGPIVDRARARHTPWRDEAVGASPSDSPAAPAVVESPVIHRSTPPGRLRRPRFTLRRRHGRLCVTVTNRPRSASVELRFGTRRVIQQKSRFTTRSSARRLRARFIDDRRVSAFSEATVPGR